MNSRNRYRNKTVRSDFWNVILNILRDRKGSFEPKVVQNYENDISGIDIFHTLINKITDRVNKFINETFKTDKYGLLRNNLFTYEKLYNYQ